MKIFAALNRWTGSWICGQASYVEMQAALTWTFFPQALSLVVWVFHLLVFGDEAFTAATPCLDAYPFLVVPLFGIIAVNLVLRVWSYFS